MPPIPQIQTVVTPEPDDVSDEDFTHVNPSSPSVGQPPSAEQRGRSRRDERSRSRERVPPHSSSSGATRVGKHRATRKDKMRIARIPKVLKSC